MSKSTFNVPNQLTALRLLLAIVLFVLMGLAQTAVGAASGVENAQRLYFAATIIFLVAAGTDWLDGFWARRYGQVTVLGRIFDPFVDKVIICGVFISLVADPRSQVAAWMAVVIVARELLVTALRGFFEQRGTDFSASMSGKLKMVLQCAAAAASLLTLSAPVGSTWHPEWLGGLACGLIWGAVAITIYSGGEYVVAATKLLRGADPSDDG